MIAFHGKPEIKEFYLSRVQAHIANDELVHGVYWADGRGCGVGCTIHSGEHVRYEPELGIPEALAQLEDRIFESLPNGEAKRWPERFLAAIPVGADLSGVWPEFAAWLMDDPTSGIAHTTDDTEVKGLCLEVARRYRARETTGPEAEALAERLRAAWAARDARDARAAWAAWDARAARAAWDARAAWAAWDAWDARDAWAARAARDAWDARDARAAWAARAARDAFALASAERLLALLAAAPIVDDLIAVGKPQGGAS